MKGFKKFIAVILAALLVCSAMPMTALADTVHWSSSRNWLSKNDEMNYSGNNHGITWWYNFESDALYFNSTTEDGIVNGEEMVVDKGSTSSTYSYCLPLYTDGEDSNFFNYAGVSNIMIGKDVKSFLDVSITESAIELGEVCGMNIVFEEGSQLQSVSSMLFLDAPFSRIELPSTVTAIESMAFAYSMLTEITIPESCTMIEDEAFTFCENLKNINFNNKLQSIGAHAFEGCAVLERVELPELITEISYSCFLGCTKLAEVKLGSNISSINSLAFSECESLKTIEIPETITKIESYTFEGSGLETIVLPEKLKAIGDRAFQKSRLTSVNIPSTVTSIGQYAFEGTRITELNFPEEGEDLKLLRGAFQNCTLLTQLYLPGRVYDIRERAFSGCTSLENVKFGTSTYVDETTGELLEYGSDIIPSGAFAGCTALTSVELSPVVSTISNSAFESTALTDINLQDTVAERIGSNAFKNTPVENIEFPNTLTYISGFAFENCKSLKTVDLSNTEIYEIYDYAFCESGITTVKLPETLQTIGRYCFYNTPLVNLSMPSVDRINSNAFQKTALENATIPDGCTYIDSNAFSNCDELVSLTLPGTLKSVYSNAFNSPSLRILVWPMAADFSNSLDNTGLKACPNLRVYGVPNTKLETFCEDNSIPFFLLSGESVVIPDAIQGTWANGTYRVTGTEGGRIYFIGEGALTNEFTDEEGNTYTALELAEKYKANKFTFEGVTSIPDGLFDNAENVLTEPVTSIILHSSVESIGDNAFRNLGLTKVSVFEGLKTIGNGAFENNKISQMNMPDSLVTIGDSAFANNALKELALPYNVTSVGAHAFENVPLATLTLNDNLLSIGAYAFNNTKIKTVVIPDNVQTIGEYSFANNTLLEKVTFGSGISIIPEGAFYKTALQVVTLPETVTAIGKKAFGSCSKLTSFFAKNQAIDFVFDKNDASNNSFGFNDNGQIINSNLIVKGQFISNLYDYANDCGLVFKGDSSTATYAGYLIQITAAPKPEKLEWFYYSSNKTMYVSGSGYFNGKELYNNDGTLFTQKLDVDRLVICPGITRIESSISFIDPTYVTLPNSLYQLSHYSFNDCTKLKTITIPDSVTMITEKTFDRCSALEAITFGNGLDSIPDSTFKGLTSLKFVDLGGIQIIGRHAFEKCTNLQTVIISDTVTSIGAYAFNKAVSIQSVTIGKNVKRIDPYAFANLPLCEKITVNTSSITTLSPVAFYNSGTSTTGMSLVFDDSVTQANMQSFNSINLTNVKLGASIETFTNVTTMPYLEKLEVSAENKNFYSYYNCLYNSDNELVYAPETLKVVDIKPGTTKIGDSAFKNSQLSTVVIPEGVTAIGNSAFKDAKELKIIYMPETLVSIGDNAFENCAKLKTVTLPYSLVTIGRQAFKKCTNLASVIFPDTLKEIGIEAFNSCDALTAVVIPETVKTIGTGAFSYCANLKEVYVWNSAQDIMCFRSPNVNIYTMVGSPAYEYARAAKIPYNAYTDEDLFFDECATKIDVLAGYLGTCADGHGDIQYLTVYEADCENDGFVIGVCEYCSEILEEIHVDALGHDYHVTASVPATALTKGVTVSTCRHCKKTHVEYTPATSTDTKIETHTVTAQVVIATDKTAQTGKSPAKNVSVVIDDSVEAVTDENGMFTLTLETGTYEAELTYAYGFRRTVYIVVEDEDIQFETPIAMIGCDFNKDGKIDNEDLTLFSYVVSAKKDDPSYLTFVDMNNDGYINAKDRAYIQACRGINSDTFVYPNIIVQK